jgi:pimeloyl-ACP methyl ester carboxylesterase
MSCSPSCRLRCCCSRGIRDPWIDAAGRRGAFQRHAPARTTEVVLEAGHCPHDEVPEQVNRAMLD